MKPLSSISPQSQRACLRNAGWICLSAWQTAEGRTSIASGERCCQAHWLGKFKALTLLYRALGAALEVSLLFWAESSELQQQPEASRFVVNVASQARMLAVPPSRVEWSYCNLSCTRSQSLTAPCMLLQEYFKVVNQPTLGAPVYTMAFPGPSVYAKQARGWVVRFAAQTRAAAPTDFQKFTGACLRAIGPRHSLQALSLALP